jgi:hypothetical protein
LKLRNGAKETAEAAYEQGKTYFAEHGEGGQ